MLTEQFVIKTANILVLYVYNYPVQLILVFTYGLQLAIFYLKF